MKNQKPLFNAYSLGTLKLRNRIIMAPMTRSRAGDGETATELMATYYSQRASAGLIISEATQVSQQGIGYIGTPGIHSEAQVESWKQVTDAVHKKEGKIFLQLWHVGRLSHPSFHNGNLPVAPSAIVAPGEVFTKSGREKMVTPRALELSEISEIVHQYEIGAKNAKRAGFDGVEIHGAFGYLPDQFLQDVSNKREDSYGGSIENRARFMLEITKAAIEGFGAGQVGVRVSPSNTMSGMGDSNPTETFGYLARELNKLPLAYLHSMEAFAPVGDRPNYIKNVAKFFREIYKNTLIANVGFNYETATALIAENTADLVSFGSLFLANPDLPERFDKNAALNKPEHATFYGGGAQGYTDYPYMS